MSKWRESIEERLIADYLRGEGWMVVKVNQGGRPVVSKGRLRMVPFNDNQYSLPDLYCVRYREDLFIEVKDPAKIKKWKPLHHKELLLEYFAELEVKKGRRLSDFRQYLFLKDIAKCGIKCGYASRVKDLEEMFRQYKLCEELCEDYLEVFFPTL